MNQIEEEEVHRGGISRPREAIPEGKRKSKEEESVGEEGKNNDEQQEKSSQG